MKKFLTRTLSGAVLLILLCSAFFIGGYYMWGLFCLISVVGIYELFDATNSAEEKNDKSFLSPLKLFTLVSVLIYYVVILTASDSYKVLTLFVVIDILVMMAFCVFGYPKYKFGDISLCAFAVIYAGIMLSFAYFTRNLDNGIYLVWLIIISSWGCDTCAYLVGMSIGRHRLAPVLSPKKSIEGAIGGSLGAGIIAAAYGWFMNIAGNVSGDYIYKLALICIVSSLASQVGDLFASAIKREYGIKDYGKIIPGHGGVLDRFDSMIVTAPIIFILGAFIK